MEREHVNEVREIIHRLRKGEGIREVARALDPSRNTIRKHRDRVEKAGLLDPAGPLPECKALARLLEPPPAPRQMRSTVNSYEEVVKRLFDAGVEGATIWRRLRDEHGYAK